jgi:2-methylisocitrate lyase-like PEP mutase family enzyme
MSAGEHFLALHRPGAPLLMPNPWDAGSARLFAHLGFEALATTSSGSAASQGRPDGQLTRDEVLEHVRAIVLATALPVNADLEDGFAAAPEGVAETIRLAAQAGAAGASIEDYRDGAILDPGLAAERVAAAAEAARSAGLALTARAENHLRGRDDLADTVRRLQSFQEAGAHVLYAPGLVALADFERVVAELDLPVNALIAPGGPTVRELADAEVARISVGGNFNLVALGAVSAAARELQEGGPLRFWETAAEGRRIRSEAFR